MEPGKKTSEFIAMLLITLLNGLVQSGVIPADFPNAELTAMITNGVVIVVYMIGRVSRKNAVTKTSNGGK